MNLNYWDLIQDMLSAGATRNKYGEYWITENNVAHRINGPAYFDEDGLQIWYKQGRIHRTDGPAIIWASGTLEWFFEGKHHRENGPAYVSYDGTQSWYLHGKLIKCN